LTARLNPPRAGVSWEPPVAAAALSHGEPIAYSVLEAPSPLVLFIHGWCCNQAYWRKQMAALRGRVRLAALDLSGHGLSRRTPDRDWSIEGFGADAIAVADALDADEVVLIGHSMGGPVALEASLGLGERCRLIVGVDTFTDAAFYRRLPREAIEMRKLTFAADFPGAMASMIEAIAAPGDEPGLIDWIAGEMTKTGPRIALPVLEALLSWDIERRWPMRRAPVETINSKEGALRGVQIPLPGLGLHALDAVGHFPMLEAPRVFNAALLSILKRHGVDADCASGLH